MTETLAKPAAIPRFVERAVNFEMIRAVDDESGDGRTFEGYAAVFGSPTRIDSWEGAFDEQIAKGAFKKSIRERMPVLQFDHGRSVTIGSMPIGVIKKLAEDDRGLRVDARMHAAPLFEPLRENLIAGSINGMSFRFEVLKEDWHFRGQKVRDPDQVLRLIWRREPDMGDDYVMRTLRELKVPELGPVVFPAYPDTSASVRSREMITVIRSEPDMVLQIRNGIARAMGEDSVEEVPDDLTETSGEKPDNIVTDEPDQPVDDVAEAPEQNEPPAPEGHSEETVEPPAGGHSEPTTPEAPRFANLDEQENRITRQRMANNFRAKMNAARKQTEKYTNG